MIYSDESGGKKSEFGSISTKVMGSGDVGMSHFSAFRPVSGTASSSSSKLGTALVSEELFTPKQNSAVSPNQSASQNSGINNMSYKVLLR